eukprot:jgi/Psemu1/316766/fgenesh1_kg.4027_\
MKLELEQTTVGIVKHMHHSLTDIEPFVEDEMDVLSQILTRTHLNAIGKQALAFLIGRNYHS